MSSDTWKLEKDLCRCCHAEGSFKSLAEPSHDLVQAEIFSEMLRLCFDVDIRPVEGPYNASTYTICEPCILRLRDASNFKQQVLLCEERFREMYRNVRALGIHEIEIKVKQEDLGTVQYELKEELSDDVDFGAGDVHDEDDDDKTVLQVLLEDKKGKGKGKAKAKPKPKPKPKAKKAVAKRTVRTPKPKAEKPQDEPKKGDKLAEYYTITGGDRYRCNQCDRSYASQPLVSQHYRFVHLKRRPRERKCPHCDQKIPGYLRAYHLEEAHGIPAPTCGVCQKKFRYNCHVLQHQKKVHMGEKTAVCRICDKSFFNNLSLRLHMSTHSNEKKYKCEVCQREFRWENNLKDHVKIHTGDKRYVCGICGKAFVQKSTLKQHASRNHPGADL